VAVLIDLIFKDIEDPYVQENFFRLREFLANQVFFDGDFKIFDISIPAATDRFRIRHGLTFIPADIINLAFEGDGNYFFHYQEFDRENLFVSTNGPVRIRFLAGKLRDPVANAVRREVFPFRAPGDVTLPASPGFVFAAVNQKSDLFWLTTEGIPSNVVGIPVLFANARIVAAAVGTEVETNYKLGFYQHQGNEIGMTLVGELEVLAGGAKKFELDLPIANVTNSQLACRLESGNTTNLKVSLVVKGVGA
jgi:hypothetical protein